MMPIDGTSSAWVIRGGLPRREVATLPLDLDDETTRPSAAPVAPVSHADVARKGERVRMAGSLEVEAERIVVRLDHAHGRALHGFVIRMGLSADEGDDAVQEMLLRLWSALRSGIAIEDPKAWSFRTIYRLAMDTHRWRRRAEAIRARLGRGAGSGSVSDPDPSANLSIWTAVDRLPPRQREILYLRYRSDMTFEEAARVMGITGGAARANATKAMATLRRSVASREER